MSHHNNKPLYTRQEWEATKKHWNGVCAYCGQKSKKNLTKEHVIPESIGGQKVRHNIIPACAKCNSDKSSEPMPIWYKKQKFFSEKALEKVYWWIGGGCYTIVLNKRGQPPQKKDGQLIPKKKKPPKEIPPEDFVSLD